MTRENIERELRKFPISEYLLEKIIDWIVEHSEQIAEDETPNHLRGSLKPEN